MMLDLITFPRLIMCISGVGVIFLNFKVRKEGFLFLALSAGLWAVYDFRLKAYEQTLIMLISTITSIIGFIRWSIKEKAGSSR